MKPEPYDLTLIENRLADYPWNEENVSPYLRSYYFWRYGQDVTALLVEVKSLRALVALMEPARAGEGIGP